MKSAVAFVLTVLMFATPATQVLAQTPQHQEVPSRHDVPSAQPVTLEQSLAPELPMMNPMNALLPAPNVGLAVTIMPRVDEPAPPPMSSKNKLIVATIAVVVFFLGLALLSWEDAP